MKCNWNSLLKILPSWMAEPVDNMAREDLQELRIRTDQPPELVTASGILWLERNADSQDIKLILNAASRYSPWSSSSIAKGYLTAPGGHRIGICGDVVVNNGKMENIRNVHSLCIRVARDFPGIGAKAADLQGSVLLIGPPCSGKTTLLRDMTRSIGDKEQICVIDERGELFPEGIDRGKRMDVLCGCSKSEGIEIMLRTMGPRYIAVDEITSEADCEMIRKAAGCGVCLIATAHAESAADLHRRLLYRSVIQERIFDHILLLNRHRCWKEVRIAG